MRFLAVFTLMTVGAVLSAQDLKDVNSIRLTRLEIQAKRQTIVEQALDLTGDEEKVFWPLYKEWRTKTAALGDRRIALAQKIDHSSPLTDAEAKQLIDTSLKLQKEHLALREDYVKRFRKILPDPKVARFFHLESKMDAIVEYSLVSLVPLAE
jgi:hypothetical protein